MSPDRGPVASRLLLLAPGLALVAWLLGTFAVWWVLVRSAADRNVGGVTAVVLGGSGLFAVGYLVATRWDRLVAVAPPAPQLGRRALEGLLLAGSVYYLGRAAGNLGPIVAAGFDASNPLCTLADAYVARQESFGGDASPSALQSLLNVGGVLAFTTVPLVVLAAGSVRVWVHRVAIASLAVYAVTWLLVGSVKGLADLGVLLLASLAVRLARHRSGADAGTVDVRRTVAIAALTAVAATVLAGALLGLRVASPAACFGMQPTPTPTPTPTTPGPGPTTSPGPGPSVSPTPAPPPDHSQPVNAPTNGVTAVLWYVSHGYSGLDASLSVPFVWTRGTGASPGLARIIGIVGVSDAGESYPVRAEKATGWPALERWQTMYPWLASDTTFVGAVLLVGLLGFGVALSWRRALVDPSGLLAATWFGALVVITVYVPLNNQPIAATSSVLGMLTLAVATVVVVVRSRRAVQPRVEEPVA